MDTFSGVVSVSLSDWGTRWKRCFTIVVNSSWDMNPFLSVSKILKTNSERRLKTSHSTVMFPPKYLLQFSLCCSLTHNWDDQQELPELDLPVVVHVIQAEYVRLQLRLKEKLSELLFWVPEVVECWPCKSGDNISSWSHWMSVCWWRHCPELLHRTCRSTAAPRPSWAWSPWPGSPGPSRPGGGPGWFYWLVCLDDFPSGNIKFKYNDFFNKLNSIQMFWNCSRLVVSSRMNNYLHVFLLLGSLDWSTFVFLSLSQYTKAPYKSHIACYWPAFISTINDNKILLPCQISMTGIREHCYT